MIQAGGTRLRCSEMLHMCFCRSLAVHTRTDAYAGLSRSTAVSASVHMYTLPLESPKRFRQVAQLTV